MRKELLIFSVFIGTLLPPALFGCSTGGEFTGKAVGEECTYTRDCEIGLVCYKGDGFPNGFCTIVCDPVNVDDEGKSTDCSPFKDKQGNSTHCVSGKNPDDLGLCYPVCQADEEALDASKRTCNRSGYRCYGYTHGLVAATKGSICVSGGKVGAKCVGDRDCALDLACYRDQTWKCSANGSCPESQYCDETGYCARQPEGFCTRSCRILPETKDDPIWEEYAIGWASLDDATKDSIVANYKNTSPDCPDGSECGPSGLCRATCQPSKNGVDCYDNRFDTICTDNTDCEIGGTCGEDGICHRSCTGALCKKLDYECREFNGMDFCLPVLYCRSNSDCSQSEVCNTANRTFACEPK